MILHFTISWLFCCLSYYSLSLLDLILFLILHLFIPLVLFFTIIELMCIILIKVEPSIEKSL